MSKSFDKQRYYRSNLILGLSGSILIHGAIALFVTSYRSPSSAQINKLKPIDIIMVEQSQPSDETVSPLNLNQSRNPNRLLSLIPLNLSLLHH